MKKAADKQGLAYPKLREPQIETADKGFREVSSLNNPSMSNLHGRSLGPPGEIDKKADSMRPLAKNIMAAMPQTKTQKKFYSIKEVSKMYGIGQWLLYHHIKTDPAFPYVNVGVKKRLFIEPKLFEQWLRERGQKNHNNQYDLPSANELMEVGV